MIDLEYLSTYVETPELYAKLAAEVTRLLEESSRQHKDMLASAMTVIEHFRPLATAVRKNLTSCPPEVVSAFDGIADMVADADAEAGA